LLTGEGRILGVVRTEREAGSGAGDHFEVSSG